jgi:nitrite reductase/ring-hydroxylating ferredoxin subunit
MIPKVVDVIGEDRVYQGQVFSDEMHFVCPWHGWEYDLKTGECAGDRKKKLRQYQTLVRDGNLYVMA